MSSEVEIVFDSGEETFAPGSFLSGRLVVDANDDIPRVHRVLVTCVGEAFCRWTEGRGDGERQFSGSEKYFKVEFNLFNGRQSGHVLTRGSHKFRFGFRLPTEIPPSFYRKTDRELACVRYGVAGSIKRGWFAKSITVEKAFCVRSDATANMDSWENVRASVGRASTDACCWPCKIGPVAAELRTDKHGYRPGESLLIDVSVENFSKREIAKCQLRLIFQLALRDTSRRRTRQVEPDEIATVDCGSFPGGRRSLAWRSRLRIPSTYRAWPLIPSGFLKFCKIIDISYRLELQLRVPWKIMPLRVPCEIMIGYAAHKKPTLAPTFQTVSSPFETETETAVWTDISELNEDTDQPSPPECNGDCTELHETVYSDSTQFGAEFREKNGFN